MNKITRLFDILPWCAEHFSYKDDLLAVKEKGVWKKYSIKEYIETAENISCGLLKLGVERGDRIASISNNCPEWNFLDMGISQVAAIHIPIYPTISESDYEYILNHAEVKYVFVSGNKLLAKIQNILPKLPLLKGIYTFNLVEGFPSLNDLVDLGKKNPNPGKLKEIKASINPEDMVTIIYTSGTMGIPKGVMLSHKNIISNAYAVKDMIPVDETSVALSYLPVCHVYERTNIYTYHILGTSLYYAENMGTIVDNMKEVHPHILTTVPRLLERFYDRILSKGKKLKGIRRIIFNWAVKLANNYHNEGKSVFYRIQLMIASVLVFKKWRDALGGNIRVIVSGGAALQERLCRIFNAAGIPVLEGYGLTETSPVIAVNTFEKGGFKFGTVGKPIAGVGVKIADDGEILCKGHNVMLGYYKEPDMTREVIDADGWFHTGDMGILEPEGHIRITGRKKEIFKTSFGKYISPQLIENKFKESSFIDTLIVLGENQKFAAALIVPDFENLKSWCDSNRIEFNSNEEIIHVPAVRKKFLNEVETFNNFFGDTEKIKRFELIDHEWSIETGELTASLKIRRKYITENYKKLIEGLFDVKDN